MILGSSSQSAVDTVLADSECYGLAGSDVRMSCFVNKALVNVGGELVKVVLGRVSIEVDACLAYDTHNIVRKGIEASRVLESEGIQTHLTFVYRCIVVEACPSNTAFVGYENFE
ncbi:Transaldolase [Camellia lanceoleosa]|uniref:Transaldolase n=1 Tax=Camellia lanceoleosa TaxID=1840588 RepID=A0ACC0J4N4_9ERIC|nr:Transaldolase [Camellia lanceoleosa]